MNNKVSYQLLFVLTLLMTNNACKNIENGFTTSGEFSSTSPEPSQNPYEPINGQSPAQANKESLFEIPTLIPSPALQIITEANPSDFTRAYFVSENGSDSNPGSEHLPFRSLNYAVTRLSPGDALFIRGGTYYESVKLTSNGTATSRILIQNFPGENVVLDGSISLKQYQFNKVSSSDPAIAGNQYWNHIYTVEIPAAQVMSGKIEIVDGVRFMKPAQYPNRPLDLYMKGADFEHLTTGDGMTTSVQNSYFNNRPINFWNGNFVDSENQPQKYPVEIAHWSHNGNNNIFYRQVTGSNNDQVNVLPPFDYAVKINSSDISRTDGFAILNHPSVLDQRGEFIYYKKSNGNLVVYLIPYNLNIDNLSLINKSVTFIPAAASKGLYTTIRGIKIKNYGQWGNSRSGGIVYPSSFGAHGVRIENLDIQNIVGTGINIYNSDNSIVRKNFIRSIKEARGISVGNSSNAIVADNIVDETERTSIYFAGTVDSIMAANYVGKQGLHGNGLTAYQNSQRIVFYRNFVNTDNIAATIQSSSDITFLDNILVSSAYSPIASWSGGTGYLRIINNNLLTYGSGATSITMGSSDNYSDCKYLNNITSGGLGGTNCVRNNNLYTRLAWFENTSSGWSFGSGEYLDSNIQTIFRNNSDLDFNLAMGSSAINRGLSRDSYFDPTRFSPINFNLDFTGKSRLRNSQIDLGPIEE